MVYISKDAEHGPAQEWAAFPAILPDKASPIPIYVQISERIKLLVRNRVLPPGALLPPERILCHKCGISRMTLRAAYDLLEREGLIRTRRGHRTVVSDIHIQKQLQEMRSFSEEIAARGATPSSKLRLLRLVNPEPEIKAFFNLREREVVYEIQRIRFSDEMPIAFETARIPQNLCPNLDRFDLVTHSLYRILEDNYGIQLHHCVDEISALTPSRIHKRELNLTTQAAILMIKRKSYTNDDTPVEHSLSAYRGDCYSAVVRSVRGVNQRNPNSSTYSLSAENSRK